MTNEQMFEVAIAIIIVGAIAVAINYLPRLLSSAFKVRSDEPHSLGWIEHEMAAEKKRYETRIDELEKQVRFLLGELTRANNKIQELEKSTAALRQSASVPARVLLICGNEDRFCNADRQALRRANVSFERLTGANKERIKAELRRKREDGRAWRMAQVSSHAGDAGIHLADGQLAEPEWWNETLEGFVCVVLAACQTMTVADAIAGLVRYVVAIREDIYDADAAEFTFSFWRGVVDGLLIPEAFEQALRETPQLAEYVSLRTA
jgi:PAS domain-containing protein